LLRHVSIFLDHPRGATLFLAKITFLKYTHWLFPTLLSLQLHNTWYTQPGALPVTYNLHSTTCCHNT